MSTFLNYLSDGWHFFINQIKSIGITDVIDILVVAIALYYVFVFIRNRRAGKLAVGVILLIALELFSQLLNLNTMQFILHNIFQIGVLALVIIFQPELRSMLENVGRDSIKGLRSIGESRLKADIISFENELCEGVNELSMSKTGALIVIECSTGLGEYISSGTIVNADMKSMMLRNIFYNKAPLHDGAVIVKDLKIYAAGCFLPLTEKRLSKDLGTRHRAAIGISEISDAVVIVVSEETGTISVAYGGVLTRDYDSISLKGKLESILLTDQNKHKHIKSRHQKNNNGGNIDEQ